MKTVFHLGITDADLQGARLALIPGDPARAERIANRIGGVKALAKTREFHSYLADLDGVPVVVCSTGIGGPSTSIAVEELAQLGVTHFIRIGTTGAIQPHIAVGDLLVSQASVRLDGASSHFAPLSYPAASDFYMTQALVEACQALGEPFHVGITASSDTFYPGQERYDTVTGYVPRALQGSCAEWQRLNVMNYEMESSTLFTMCAALGLKAGCIAGVIVNRTLQEIPDHDHSAIELRSTDAAIAAAKRILANI